MASISKVRGKYRALIRRRGHQPVSKSFDSQKDAAAWARKIEREMDTLEYRPTSRDNIADLASRYLDDISRHGKGATKAIRCGFAPLQRLTGGYIGEAVASRLTIDDVLRHCRAGKPAASTVQHRLTWLNVLLRHCRDTWQIHVPDVLRPARATLRTTGELTALTERDRRVSDAELDKIIAATQRLGNGGVRVKQADQPVNVNYGDVFRFAVETGMRRSEIANLRWDDLDVANGTILIRDRKDPRRKVGNHQRVPLLVKAMEIVQRQPRLGPTIFLLSASSITNRFIIAARRAGVEDVHFHDLRHEGISRLFEMGYQIQEVSLFSGHKTWTQLRRYTQLRAESIRRLDESAA